VEKQCISEMHHSPGSICQESNGKTVDGQRTDENRSMQQRIWMGTAASGKIRVQTHNDNRSDMQNSEERAQQPTHAQSSNQDCRRMHLNRRFQGQSNTDQDFNQRAKPQKNKTPGISQEAHATITQYAIEKATQRGIREGRELPKTEQAIEQATQRGIEERREIQKQKRRLTCQGCKQRGNYGKNRHIGHTDEQCWYNPQSRNDNTPSCAWCKQHRAPSAHKDHTVKNCWKQADHTAICEGRAGQQRELRKEQLRKEQNTIQMKKDKTKDFANGGW
jgi:hypothetical protein